MSYEVRFLVIVLAAFAWSSMAGAMLVAALWHRVPTRDAVSRAATLTRLRLLPLGIGGTVAALAALAFVRFEPRNIDESAGLVLTGLSLAGAAFAAHGLVRLWRMWWQTRRAVREWLASASPVALPGITAPALVVESAFPVVAVVGLFRPRLVIARNVLDACSADELRAILAHEQGHIERSDNLRRLLFGAAPDILAWLPLSNRLQSAWLEAAEDAADDHADRLGSEGRVLLAQALLRVARLATGAPPVALPSSTLFRGEADRLDRRVRRLLLPGPPSAGGGRSQGLRTAAVAAVGLALFTLESIHDALEAAVNYLP